jgi:hypothetical protein
MIRLLPCARLAPSQTGWKIGKSSSCHIQAGDIPYGIFQLSPILAIRHNIAFLLFFPEHEMQARFARRAFFRSDMHTVTLNIIHFSLVRHCPTRRAGRPGESVLEVRVAALR